MRIILASSSPRRKEILSLLGIPFEVIAPNFEERSISHRVAEAEVLDFARGKARSVAARNPEGMVIGSDTMILVDGEKIGKPGGMDDARRVLRVLAGKTHRIFTSVAVINGVGGPGLEAVEEVTVRMRNYGETEIESYLTCGESLDKAGAYSIQGRGRSLIQSVAGDYFAAVGLPLKPVASYLAERGISFPLDVDKLYSDRSYGNWQSFA